MSEKLAYTVAEVEQLTPLSRRTIYREIKAGNLVARKRGSATMILAADLHNYLAGLPAAQEAKAA